MFNFFQTVFLLPGFSAPCHSNQGVAMLFNATVTLYRCRNAIKRFLAEK